MLGEYTLLAVVRANLGGAAWVGGCDTVKRFQKLRVRVRR